MTRQSLLSTFTNPSSRFQSRDLNSLFTDAQSRYVHVTLPGFILLNATVPSPVFLLSELTCQCPQVVSVRVCSYNQEAKEPTREEEGPITAAGDVDPHLWT